MKLEQTFRELLNVYSQDEQLKNDLWQEIKKCYSQRKRYYHNLIHLDNMLAELEKVKNQLSNWPALLFALYYHDIVYNVLQHNNEAKSADVAAKRMKKLGIKDSTVEKCTALILSSKTHEATNDSDTNYFTDSDLFILGCPWDVYKTYAVNVRKEYGFYPDMAYKAGRKKIIAHFLGMKQIFKTDYFNGHYELLARQNLNRELEEMLS